MGTREYCESSEQVLSSSAGELKVRKISFAPQFIELIENGTKTQTRRPIKPYKDKWMGHFDCRFGIVGEFLLISGTQVTIQIEKIRVESLHDISEEDAIKEGVKKRIFNKYSTAFLLTWDQLYKGSMYRAGINPWVWVIEFKVIEVKNEMDKCKR